MNVLQCSLGFMFSENKEHLVVTRKAKPMSQVGLLSTPGGKLEYDIRGTQSETMVQCMAREFQEETHVQHSNWTLFCKYRAIDSDLGPIEVHCFKSFSDKTMWTVKKLIDDGHYENFVEPVFILPTSGFPFDAAVPCMPWMLPMALAESKDSPSYWVVTEKY